MVHVLIKKNWIERGKNFNKIVPSCPRLYKPKQYPHTEKPGNMRFLLDVPPLGSSTELRREQLVLRSCPSQQAVAQKRVCVSVLRLPPSYRMPWRQILAQWEKQVPITWVVRNTSTYTHELEHVFQTQSTLTAAQPENLQHSCPNSHICNINLILQSPLLFVA